MHISIKAYAWTYAVKVILSSSTAGVGEKKNLAAATLRWKATDFVKVDGLWDYGAAVDNSLMLAVVES